MIERPALSEISKYIPQSNLSRYNSIRRYYSPHSYLNENTPPIIKPAESTATLQPNQYAAPATAQTQPPPELLHFIEKQEGYIEQLERESQFCRVSSTLLYTLMFLMLYKNAGFLIYSLNGAIQGELSNILGKVKDVISENEALTEQAKSGMLRSDTSESGSNDFDYRGTSYLKDRRDKVPLSGPNIVFESRISELEAQLAQAEMDVKKLTQENIANKQKMNDSSYGDSGTADIYKKQIEILQRFVSMYMILI